ILDNLSNSSETALERVKEITGKNFKFEKIDMQDEAAMKTLFEKYSFSDVIHFAGRKAVGESVSMPLEYYRNNVTGTLNMLKLMRKHKIKNIVFSSSATVYGDPHQVPIKEDFPLQTTNPYGRTKYFIEEIMRDLYTADNKWNIALLRYFNPVGAHKSGRIGEDPKDIPNNLLPYISQVAVGIRKELSVFGGDYPTKDGTGVRDYIHVVDLARGHLKALQKLKTNPGAVAYNLGTGRGYSVLEMVKAFEQASGKKIPYKIVERRPGDIAQCFADPSFARKELDWEASKDINDMCSDTWRWQSANPNGYEAKS
ncbi:MAG TPA: UDP-glucose 4-epimerase GalE, partial [Spirochaetota bacterium]|nr:UDP-glucose 4-epimerase GalE [Spirochaetota bacterium]